MIPGAADGMLSCGPGNRQPTQNQELSPQILSYHPPTALIQRHVAYFPLLDPWSPASRGSKMLFSFFITLSPKYKIPWTEEDTLNCKCRSMGTEK